MRESKMILVKIICVTHYGIESTDSHKLPLENPFGSLMDNYLFLTKHYSREVEKVLVTHYGIESTDSHKLPLENPFGSLMDNYLFLQNIMINFQGLHGILGRFGRRYRLQKKYQYIQR